MGAGKTTIGRILARKLGKRFIDSDHEIEARTGASIPWIFEIEGEASFRRREAEVIRDSLLAIQNGTRPQRILRLRLDAAKSRIERVEVLAAAQPTWDEPTLGEVIGEEFCFVANSHWPKFGANGELPAAVELSPPRIECVAL